VRLFVIVVHNIPLRTTKLDMFIRLQKKESVWDQNDVENSHWSCRIILFDMLYSAGKL